MTKGRTARVLVIQTRNPKTEIRRKPETRKLPRVARFPLTFHASRFTLRLPPITNHRSRITDHWSPIL